MICLKIQDPDEEAWLVLYPGLLQSSHQRSGSDFFEKKKKKKKEED